MTDQRAMKSRKGPNLARSAKPPVMSAGVMMANIIWKAMKSRSGTPLEPESTPTPLRPTWSRLPMRPSPWSGPKARE